MKAGKAIKNVEVFHKKIPAFAETYVFKSNFLEKFHQNCFFNFLNFNHIESGEVFRCLVPFFT